MPRFSSLAEPCDDYIAVFKARVDNINAHKGLAGKHPGHGDEMFARITEERELMTDIIKNMSSNDKKKLQMDVQ